MKKMIEINGLYKSYTDEEEVVKDIHMKVEKGTIHGLIGHNGSGKKIGRAHVRTPVTVYQSRMPSSA